MEKHWAFLERFVASSRDFGSSTDSSFHRFEANFNHHSKLNLERISFHAGRENAAVLPLVVRLSYLKIGSME